MIKHLLKLLIGSALILSILVNPNQSQINENINNINNIIALGEYSTKIDIDGVVRIGKNVQAPDMTINRRPLIKLGRVSQMTIIDNNTSINVEYEPEMVDISMENATAERESETNAIVESPGISSEAAFIAPNMQEFGAMFPAMILTTYPIVEESAKRDAKKWLVRGNENYSSQKMGGCIEMLRTWDTIR